MVFKGYIKDILTQKENDWGRYRVESKSGVLKLAVGVIPFAALDMYVELSGEDTETQWGPQFTIKDVLSSKPSVYSGIKSFLCDFITGIGPVKAEKLVARYGNTAADMLKDSKGQKELIDEGFFTRLTITMPAASYKKNAVYEPLVMFFNGATTKLQTETITKIYKGTDAAIKKIEKNPYCLYDDIKGFGFLKTDRLAKSLNVKATSPFRIKAGMTYILDTAAENDGDCYLTYDVLKDRCIKLLGQMPKFEDITEKIAENAAEKWDDNGKEKFIKAHKPLQETIDGIEETIETRKYISECFEDVFKEAIADGRLINDKGRIVTKRMHELETFTAKTFSEMASETPTFFISKNDIEKTIKEVEAEKDPSGDFKIEEEQKRAIYNGLTHRISIMTGGPGTGKTTTIEAIAKGFLKSGHRKGDVLLFAPTGRAAQRIKEQTGYEASTIHRGIFDYSTEKVTIKPPPHGKLIICDEFSMVDISLAMCLAKFASESNLVIVGDVNQIASVGPGKVLKDLISSKTIPTTFLKLGHRNVGSIARNAQLINSGAYISDYIYDDHFHYRGTKNKNDLPAMVINDYIKNVNKYGIQEVMLATAMREKGPCCVNKLNEQFQEIFTGKNDKVTIVKNHTYALGDRVMQTKNDYKFVRARGKKLELGVFNGEKGTVVKVIHKEDNEDLEDRIIVRFDDGSFGGYNKNNAINLALAYATTVHKCQGSEAKCMMMVYTFSDFMLLRRSLFYTGETRAKEEFFFYGEEKPWGARGSVFDVAVKKLDDKERNTMLSEKLENYTKQLKSREATS